MHADLHRFACTLYSVYVKTSRANYPSYHVSSFELCDFSCSHGHTHTEHTVSMDLSLLRSFLWASLSFILFDTLIKCMVLIRKRIHIKQSISFLFCVGALFSFASSLMCCLFFFSSSTFIRFFDFFFCAGGDCNASVCRWTIDGNIRSNVCTQQFKAWTTSQATRCKWRHRNITIVDCISIGSRQYVRWLVL